MNREVKGDRMGNRKEFFRELLLNNLSIKLIAIVGAVLVWLFIVNIDDPNKTRSFLVHVETTNEDALRAVNKVYEVVEGSTASVSVTGKRSVVDNLEVGDIRATADLSDLSAVNAVAIKAELKKNVSSDVTLECNQVLKVSLEDMETKQVKVTVETEGTPADGFTVGECIAKPNVIEVTGGESVVDRINTVRVTINVNGATENFTKRLEPVAYDKKGNRVVSSTLSFGVSRVKVRARLLENKTIPVKVQVKGTPAKGYEYVETKCLPEEIEVAGTQKALADVSKIVIPVSVEGLKSNSSGLEKEIAVEEYLPDAITIPEEYQKISIKIVVEKLQKKTIQISVDHLKLNNVKDGYVGEAYNNSNMVELVIQGRESVLNALPNTAFSGYVDCSGLEQGTYTLPVSIDLKSTCSVVKGDTVHVVITPKKTQEEKEKATATPKATTGSKEEATPEPTKKAEQNTEE